MNREKWIEDILQSAGQVQAVSSSPFMATRIEARLQAPAPVNTLPLQWVYASAAVLLALLVMNIAILRSTTRQKIRPSGVQELMQENGWSNNDLYSMNLSNHQHE